jgi:chemotaxis methyl-accepting protein methylase
MKAKPAKVTELTTETITTQLPAEQTGLTGKLYDALNEVIDMNERRNVMIYFNSHLQAQVHHLLHDSLVMFGVLGLGAEETMKFSPHEPAYKEIDSGARLYRRIA